MFKCGKLKLDFFENLELNRMLRECFSVGDPEVCEFFDCSFVSSHYHFRHISQFASEIHMIGFEVFYMSKFPMLNAACNFFNLIFYIWVKRYINREGEMGSAFFFLKFCDAVDTIKHIIETRWSNRISIRPEPIMKRDSLIHYCFKNKRRFSLFGMRISSRKYFFMLNHCLKIFPYPLRTIKIHKIVRVDSVL